MDWEDSGENIFLLKRYGNNVVNIYSKLNGEYQMLTWDLYSPYM